ncbi:hypothetical protein GCM10012320_35700 [Sinomonas cellulolyticus]|nr:hypothetical protein GCM10012320_35700 [Sinomonas sp. KCTC 49339]
MVWRDDPGFGALRLVVAAADEAIAAYLALALVGLGSHDDFLVRAADAGLEPVGWFVILPLCLASLATGLVSSLGSPWDLFRHWWVVIKLVINVLCTLALLMHLGATSRLSTEALAPTWCRYVRRAQRRPRPEGRSRHRRAARRNRARCVQAARPHTLRAAPTGHPEATEGRHARHPRPQSVHPRQDSATSEHPLTAEPSTSAGSRPQPLRPRPSGRSRQDPLPPKAPSADVPEDRPPALLPA